MAFGWSYGSSVTIYRGKRISLDFDRDTGFSERAVRIVLFSTNKNSTIKGSSAVDSFKLFPLPSALEMLTWEIDLAAGAVQVGEVFVPANENNEFDEEGFEPVTVH